MEMMNPHNRYVCSACGEVAYLDEAEITVYGLDCWTILYTSEDADGIELTFCPGEYSLDLTEDK
jgi:hypothetical protein